MGRSKNDHSHYRDNESLMTALNRIVSDIHAGQSACDF